MEELLLGLLAILLLTVAVLLPIATLVLVIILFRRVGGLGRRLARLEADARAAGAGLAPAEAAEVVQAAVVTAPEETHPIAALPTPPAAGPLVPRPEINWELLIGRKGLGWVAVVLLLFGTAFFLRYAYENQWIGPIGRVAVGLLAGLALVLGGWRYHLCSWRIFSQMLSSG
nr:DUF2339 domain-containing protein [Candidatus Anammoximicrobium sp.]